MVNVLAEMPVLHSGSLGLILGSGPDSGSLLRWTLGGNGDGSSNWVPGTYVEVLD